MSDRHRARRRATRRTPVVLTTAAVLVVASTGAAFGLFTAMASGSQQFSTATLDPPAGPATEAGTCDPDAADEIVVSWTPTTSTWADGYEVLRSPSDAGPFTVVGTAYGLQAATFTDSGLSFSTTFYYQVRARKLDWRSTPTVTVSRTTRTTQCA